MTTMHEQHAVLHLIGSFHQGGSESQAVQLARLLQESGRYRVLVASMDSAGPLRRDIDRLNIGYVPEYKLTCFYNLHAASQLRRFAAYLRTQRVAILHTHDFYTNVFGMWAGALAGVPVRIAARRESSSIRSSSKRALERFSYRVATRVVANCEEVRRQLIEEGVVARKIEVIYNGVDLTRMRGARLANRSEVAASFGLPTNPERRFITIVANLRLPVKGHVTFLRAARIVSEAAPHAAFVIAGEGELIGQMRSLAGELGILSQTFFLGNCPRIPELLSVTEIGVLSSLHEGFPNAILEYMAAGCPVVATDVGGVREAAIDEETGYLVRAGDYQALAQRIVALLDDPKKAHAMGVRGRTVAEQRFSLDAQLDSTTMLYKKILAARLTGAELYTDDSEQRRETIHQV